MWWCAAEGESKAFYEESEGEKRANKTAIIGLRGEIKLLHIRIQEAKQVSASSVTSALYTQPLIIMITSIMIIVIMIIIIIIIIIMIVIKHNNNKNSNKL